MISRRLVIGLLGAGVTALALYATPVALAFSPEARNAKLDETLRGLVEGRSTPGIVALILQDGRPVYSRSVGVREVGSAALGFVNAMTDLPVDTAAGGMLYVFNRVTGDRLGVGRDVVDRDPHVGRRCALQPVADRGSARRSCRPAVACSAAPTVRHPARTARTQS